MNKDLAFNTIILISQFLPKINNIKLGCFTFYSLQLKQALQVLFKSNFQYYHSKPLDLRSTNTSRIFYCDSMSTFNFFSTRDPHNRVIQKNGYTTDPAKTHVRNIAKFTEKMGSYFLSKFESSKFETELKIKILSEGSRRNNT